MKKNARNHAADDGENRERMLRVLESGSPEERRELEHWLKSDPAARDLLREMAEQAIVIADEARSEGARHAVLKVSKPAQAKPVSRAIRWVPLSLAAGLAALLAVGVTGLILRPNPVVSVADLSGAVRWTGSGGEVRPVERAGTRLPGGTLETLSENSAATIHFHDGSEIVLTGIGQIVFSQTDRGKSLHLKWGALTAEIARQPAGKPFRMHTPTASLEVLGTRFELESRTDETLLAVAEGTVRLTRVIDGSTVDVGATQQVRASLNRQEKLSPVAPPQTVREWASDLSSAPERSTGDWLPAQAGRPARLVALPDFLPNTSSGPVTIHRAGMQIPNQKERVLALEPESRIRIGGRLSEASSLEVMLGISDRENRGSGNYFHRTEVLPAGPFTLDLPAGEFRKWRAASEDGLPPAPKLRQVLAYTINEDAGLEIESFEVVLP